MYRAEIIFGPVFFRVQIFINSYDNKIESTNKVKVFDYEYEYRKIMHLLTKDRKILVLAPLN
jgi:hypothetical protein